MFLLRSLFTLPFLSASSVVAQSIFAKDSQCSATEPCQDGSFCDFSLDGTTTGLCRECEWHPHLFCFESGLSDMGAKSCADACASKCVGKASLHVGGQEFATVGMIGSPNTKNSVLSGPLVHCPSEICGDDVSASGGVCLIKEGEYSFLDKALSCKEAGGVAALFYAEWFPDETEVLLSDPGIPSFGIAEEHGIGLEANSIGSIANVSLDDSKEICFAGCSDFLPPCPGEHFCNYDFEGNRSRYGKCEKCWMDEHSPVGEDCFFSGLTIRGAQECASSCGSRLKFPKCKFCPSDLSVIDLGNGLQGGNDVCEFCPGGLQEEYNNQEVSLFGEGINCFQIDEFYQKYEISKSEPNCLLAQTVNYRCGCNGIGYGGANTSAKQVALTWMPRVIATLSFLCSTSIIVDVAREKRRREHLFGQLMIGLSTFDLLGSAAYALTSLPLPSEDLIHGSQGNMATCKAQGFFIQMGTVASYFNVSLAVYYLLFIKYSWPEQKIKKWRIWLFVCPILVGTAFACAGIPFYDNMILWCNNSSSYWSEIPLCIGIFVSTCIMASVCLHVYKLQRASANWNQADIGASLSAAVCCQAFWVTFAFYIVWIPYLVLQFLWASGKAYSLYQLILLAGTACTAQGCWNFFVYMRPRARFCFKPWSKQKKRDDERIGPAGSQTENPSPENKAVPNRNEINDLDSAIVNCNTSVSDGTNEPGATTITPNATVVVV